MKPVAYDVAVWYRGLPDLVKDQRIRRLAVGLAQWTGAGTCLAGQPTRDHGFVATTATRAAMLVKRARARGFKAKMLKFDPIYFAEPSPRSNSEGRLSGAWRIVNCSTNRVVARFDCDGRDACERWGHAHPAHTLHWR